MRERALASTALLDIGRLVSASTEARNWGYGGGYPACEYGYGY